MGVNDKNSAVVVVKGDNADAQRKIAETLSTFQKFASAVNAQSPIAVRAFRSEADAAQELLQKLGASDKQMAALGATTKKVEMQADAFKERMGGALLGISSGFREMAASGDMSGRAIKEVIEHGAEMAFTFGAGGPIFAAVGVIGIAMFQFFERTKKEIEELRKKAAQELLKLKESSDPGATAKALQRLYSGDPLAALRAEAGEIKPGDVGAQQAGIQGLTLQRAALQARLNVIVAQQRSANLDVDQVEALNRQNAELSGQIDAIDTQLLPMKARQRELEATLTLQVGQTVEMERTGEELAKEKADSKERETAAQRALNDMLHNEKALLREIAIDAKTREDQNAALGGKNPVLPGLSTSAPRPSFGAVTPSAAASGIDVSAPSFWGNVASGMEHATNGVMDFNASLADVTSGSLLGFADASARSFSLWVSGSRGAGAAFKQFIGQSIASVAGKEAAMDFARGIRDIASGIRASADPITAPLAGFYFTAAAKDFAAGAAFAAVAGGGAAMAGGGGGGGGGGTGGARMNRGIGDSMSDANTQPLTLNLVGDYMDPGDTRFVDKLAGVIESISGRRVVVNR